MKISMILIDKKIVRASLQLYFNSENIKKVIGANRKGIEFWWQRPIYLNII